jgi:excinuclease ABC subunit C
MTFTYVGKNKIGTIPHTAGVYCFTNKQKRILYIGKAIRLRERVRNHFSQPTYKDEMFLKETSHIGYQETLSEIEALVLESRLIKEYSPKYNTLWKDDKNYFFVQITKEQLPRILITHQKNASLNKNPSIFIGPFVDGKALKKTLFALRRIFPYYTSRSHPHTQCPWCRLDLCPGPDPDKKSYRKDIQGLIAILEGKNKNVGDDLKKEMKKLSGKKRFEDAVLVRDRILSLEKVLAHARVLERTSSVSPLWEDTLRLLISSLGNYSFERMEAYDISNIQGKEAVGSMVVFIQGKPAPSLYRKFKIRLPSLPNDIAMLKEVFSRRITHKEWEYPGAILIDGGKAQHNAGMKVIKLMSHSRSRKTTQ